MVDTYIMDLPYWALRLTVLGGPNPAPDNCLRSHLACSRTGTEGGCGEASANDAPKPARRLVARGMPSHPSITHVNPSYASHGRARMAIQAQATEASDPRESAPDAPTEHETSVIRHARKYPPTLFSLSKKKMAQSPALTSLSPRNGSIPPPNREWPVTKYLGLAGPFLPHTP